MKLAKKEIALQTHGHFEVSVNGGPWTIDENIVVTEGMNYLLSAGLGGGAQKTTFYIAPFTGNVTPLLTWTGANFTANSTETTNYDEANRQLWADDAVSAGVITNTAAPAVFTASAGGVTIRGAGLVEMLAKGATTGILVAAARFSTDKVLAAGEDIRIIYTITATSA